MQVHGMDGDYAGIGASAHTHVISVWVEDKFGVLQRVGGVFSRRGFNISSITVGTTEQEGVSRMTVVTHGDDAVIEKMIKQLNKLIEVVKVVELEQGCTGRELVLAKIHMKDHFVLSELMNYTKIFGGKIVSARKRTLTVEIAGGPQKIDEFLELVKPFGIKELVRTGLSAISRD